MTRYAWLFVIAAGAAACSSGAPPGPVRPSVVSLRNPSDSTAPPLILPDTVRRGTPFTVTFGTVYNSPICWKPDGDSITPNPILASTGLERGSLTTIVPMEVWVLPPGQFGPCGLLQSGLRSASVVLTTPGIDTVRFIGRAFPPLTENYLDTVSAKVVVLP